MNIQENRLQSHYERIERGGTRFYKETPIDEITSSHEIKIIQVVTHYKMK